ncbi:TCTP-domain-containing protein [Piedraia hortae CBS 480.64]|uniref:Translationally-controlled tumor protein homolog n=1 Tax=Piedraia hortae CBS 480.64 TaxID=1314780 RepID=A0A6A7BW10_9PEZI|nr:TCTP-domain-containing protein [Piedraia hortae CBS 480.64]
MIWRGHRRQARPRTAFFLCPTKPVGFSFFKTLLAPATAQFFYIATMIVYKDLITGAELISDSYDLKEIDGIAYEVDCRMINVGGEKFDTGANASAEEAEEGVDDNVQRVNDVIHSFNLEELQGAFPKPVDYGTYLKKYIKTIKAKMVENGSSEEEAAEFEKNANKFTRDVILGTKTIPSDDPAKKPKVKHENFENWEFLGGEGWSGENPGMVMLKNYREDGITPYIVFWKHGLKEEKV